METLEELAADNQKFKKVLDSYKNFAAKVEPWSRLSEQAFMEAKENRGRR